MNVALYTLITQEERPMRHPKVGVCIPTYNRAGYLREAIDSVLAQSYQDYELLVVDNASTDHTSRVVGSYNDPRISYHRNESNIGMVGNWNRCLELAKGEYVAILHDDDLWLPRFLERTIAVLDLHPGVGFIHTARYNTNGDGSRRRLRRPWSEDIVEAGRVHFEKLMLRCEVSCSTVVVRRSVYSRLGHYDERLDYCPDWEMWLRISLYYDAAYLSEPLACYRVTGQRVTGEREENALQIGRERWLALKLAFRRWPYGDHERRQLERAAYRRRADVQLSHAWGYHYRSERRRSRQEAALAIAIDPSIVIRRPYTLAAVVIGSVLPKGLTLGLGRLQNRVGQMLGRNGQADY